MTEESHLPEHPHIAQQTIFLLLNELSKHSQKEEVRRSETGSCLHFITLHYTHYFKCLFTLL